jgi:hypothetical protein
MKNNKILQTSKWGEEWAIESIKEYGSNFNDNLNPYQLIWFCVITNEGHLKMFKTTVNFIQQSFNDLLDQVCENQQIKTIVGPISEKYDFEYYEDYLNDHEILYTYDTKDKCCLNLTL